MPSTLKSTLLAATFAAGAAVATSACSQAPEQPVKSGDVVVFGDWHADAPGVRHHVTVPDLPAPAAGTAAVANVAPPPAGALPKVPPGFSVAVFAEGLQSPRAMRVAPNGDVFVSEQTGGRIRMLRAANGAAKPTENSVFVDGLDQPFGMAFYPLGPNPQWIYVAENNRVVRYPYQNGDLKVRGPAQVIIPQLTKSTGGHWTRDLTFSADGQKLFVSVGSQGNIDEGMGKKTVAEAQTYDKAHGLGAAWGSDENRAAVLVSDPMGQGLRIFAAGIRNCSGLTRQPQTGQVWCSVNERDMLGDNLVPDYATHVQEGAFYGWPWYYLGDHEDPRLKGERPDLKDQITVPDVLFQAHSAAVQIKFYDAPAGAANAFPAEYQGDAFVALHGSWNRARRTGYKVAVIPMKDGAPTGGYVDFMTGFVLNESDVWGRPYGLAVQPDGALLVTDDANGRIYRVTPTK
jgi:glucose/arabinose dehydrogenase